MSTRQIPVHIFMSLANIYPCILAASFEIVALSTFICGAFNIAGIRQSEASRCSEMSFSVTDADKCASFEMLQSRPWLLDSSMEDCHTRGIDRESYISTAREMGNDVTGELDY